MKKRARAFLAPFLYDLFIKVSKKFLKALHQIIITKKGDYTLIFTESIKKNHIFKALYQRGNTFVNPFFAIYTRENRPFQGMETNHLGITVGVKLGNAVTRNKVRRRISAIYRLAEPGLVPGYHIVIVARNRCANSSYAQMEEALLKLFDQLALTKSPKHSPLPPHKIKPQSKGRPYQNSGKKQQNKAKPKENTP